MAAEPLLEMKFNADPRRLRGVRERVQEAVEATGCCKEFLSDLIVAVNEACMNIMQHAYKGDTTGEIALQIMNNDGEVVVELTDFAEPVDPATCCPRDLQDLRPGGLGTHFIGEIMDTFEYGHLPDQRGNVLHMTKKIVTNQGSGE